MNRTIKFRAWNGSEWIYLNVSNPKSNYKEEWGIWIEEVVKKGKSIYQFTGLKDKNGVEIYEGDIFSLEDGNDMQGESKNCYYKVVWRKIGFDLERITCGSENIDFKSLYWKGGLYGVIGNIYQNPELLPDK